MATRPTADRVRETLFSMLASRLGSFEELRVADLFAGSGALGFEALSRGAASATFVESDSDGAAAIRRNAEQARRGAIACGSSAARRSRCHDPIRSTSSLPTRLMRQVREAPSVAGRCEPDGLRQAAG